MIKFSAGFIVLALASTAWTADVTGTWVGKIQTDLSKFPEKYRAQIQVGLAKSKVSMNFKNDHTFKSVGAGPDGVSHASSGTWSQRGNSVTVVTKLYDGKPITKEPSRKLTVASDGKSMSMVMETKSSPKAGSIAPPVKIVFARKA